MNDNNGLLLGKGLAKSYILPEMTNRHGLIAGATGTGKTVSLQVIAEAFSDIGVPVFLADVKGDLTGLSVPGKPHPKITERLNTIGIENFEFTAYPTVFWDLYGQQGHPVRTTISEMGPLLLSRLLNLTEVQTGVMHMVFKIADDRGFLLLDLKDLRAMLKYIGENAKEYTLTYGNISTRSIGAIQRSLLALESQGGDQFFGEPALDIHDLMGFDSQHRGNINILASQKLFNAPALYSTFLLWLLSELFESLPEVGDSDKPRMIFFFDEAHLLFDDAPKALLDKIEQVAKLIRSKGVGVFFVTQNPLDIPNDVLNQLGNRIQHALRAYSPREQRAVKVAADTFRQNPEIDILAAITNLGVGEALVSCLDHKGRPSMVDQVLMCPPHSQIGPAPADHVAEIIAASHFGRIYDTPLDRVSAYERLVRVFEQEQLAEEAEQRRKEQEKEAKLRKKATTKTKSTRRSDSAMERAMKSAATSVGRQVGNELIRGLFGMLNRK